MIVELANPVKSRLINTPTTMKKLIVKPSPLQQKPTMAAANGPQQQQQIIVLPSNLLLNSKSNEQQATIFRLATTSATAAAGTTTGSHAKVVRMPSIRVTTKRPAPSSTTTASAAAMDDCDESDQPTRKRANLDHLTPEEKLMRRKLKNRVAAQNARDKKRVKMDEMEIKMKELEVEHERIKSENASLKALNARLREENEMHSQLKTGSCSSCGSTTQLKIETMDNYGTTTTVPATAVGVSCPTPPPSETGCPVSPASSSGCSDYSLVDSRSLESAEESGSRVGRIVDGLDDDNGSQGLLSGGSVCGSDSDSDNNAVQSALFDLEELLFPSSSNGSAIGANSVAVKEETHDVTGGRHQRDGHVGAAPLMTSSSWPHDQLAAIKVEEETGTYMTSSSSSAAAAALNDSGVLDLDNCFSELFPDLAVAEAGIVL